MLSRQAATLALGHADYHRHDQYVISALDTLLGNVQEDKASRKTMVIGGSHDKTDYRLPQLPRPEVEVRRASYDAMVTIATNSEIPSELKIWRQYPGPIPDSILHS